MLGLLDKGNMVAGLFSLGIPTPFAVAIQNVQQQSREYLNYFLYGIVFGQNTTIIIGMSFLLTPYFDPFSVFLQGERYFWGEWGHGGSSSVAIVLKSSSLEMTELLWTFFPLWFLCR